MTTPLPVIGQQSLIQKISELLTEDKFPRFSIFIGDKGSGRQTLINHLLQDLGTLQICGIDMDSIRDTIEQAYKVVSPTVYVFPNADMMSVGAKNALLKVTEEPPNNAYFVMTLLNSENTLPTIKSRANLFYMEAYTKEQILTYYHKHARGEEGVIQLYCQTPGDVDLMCSYNIREFYEFIKMVVDNIEKVSGANSFKIGSRLDLGVSKKGEDEPSSASNGYDLGLFWKAFREQCLLELYDNSLKYSKGIEITCRYLYNLRIAGINKVMAFDNWLLDIRKEWMNYAEG